MTPRKPNSALRTVAMSLLSTRARVLIYIRGQTHNLQKHSYVLVSAGRTKDLPGLKYKAIRGWNKGDFSGLSLRRNGASRYGTKTSLFRIASPFRYYYRLY